jgi:hypothetical protein
LEGLLYWPVQLEGLCIAQYRHAKEYHITAKTFGRRHLGNDTFNLGNNAFKHRLEVQIKTRHKNLKYLQTKRKKRTKDKKTNEKQVTTNI